MKIIYKISAYVCLISMLNMITIQTAVAMRENGKQGDIPLRVLTRQDTPMPGALVQHDNEASSPPVLVSLSKQITVIDHRNENKQAQGGLDNIEEEEDSSNGPYYLMQESQERQTIFTFPSKTLPYLRWADIDRVPIAVILYPFLKDKDTDPTFNASHHWLTGHGVWLHSKEALQKAFCVEGFRQGMAFILMRCVHLGIFALAAAQLSQVHSLYDFFGVFSGGQQYALTALAYNASGSVYVKDLLYISMALPFIWGGVKAYLGIREAKADPETNLSRLCSLSV